MTSPLRTARLTLVPATLGLCRADLAGPAALAQALNAAVPESWPPEHYDSLAIEYWLRRLEQDPSVTRWVSHYLVADSDGSAPRVLGVAGYKGPPAEDGSVEVGYSILSEARRQGLATEAVGALVEAAFADARVTRVLAETLPALLSSIRVLEKNGFALLGEGSESGVIRFELSRDDFHAGRRSIPDHLRSRMRQLDHLRWADRQVLSALRRTTPPPPEALRLFLHVLGAEGVWLARLQGKPSDVAVWPALDLAAAADLAESNALGFRSLLWPLTSLDLDRLVPYTNSAGEAFQTTVDDILTHVCLHGAYHRGQVARILRIDGAAPIPTDYIAFVRGRAAATVGAQ